MKRRTLAGGATNPLHILVILLLLWPTPVSEATAAAKFRANDPLAVIPAAFSTEFGVMAPTNPRPASRLGDPLEVEQWALSALSMSAAWAITPGTSKIRVAVIDSGIDFDHEDLPSSRIVAGWDYVDADANPQDENGHGTHIAGIIAAQRENGVGIAGMANVTIVAIRVLDASLRGSCLNVALAVIEAVGRGSDIINLSLSCEREYEPLSRAINLALSNNVIVIAAAGSSTGAANAPDCLAYPARYHGVISVGSVNNLLGADPEGCTGGNLTIAAPGVNAISTVPHGYAWRSGTSMAAAHASGAAALVRSISPFNPTDVARILTRTARDLGEPGWDPTFGAGLIEPSVAVAVAMTIKPSA